MTTKNLIKETLLRLLEDHSCDELTVKMVCKEAGISKQTLYNHYYSLIDALEEAYKSEFESALENCNTYSNWVEGFKSFLRYLHSTKKRILHIYFSSYRDELIRMIRKYGEILVKRGISDCSEDMGIEVDEKDSAFMLSFYMNVFMGIVVDYLDGRMSESPEYIASRCDAMMRSHIHTTLQNIDLIKKGQF
ncbi:MAG: TetR/AcrR family transcriptional regulator [Clostridia bacterium]|nr:TetR/AcrR family transcriptional regulator [Clostridia bacterium]